ncbi:PQQ-dependent sugar dehydrogenase [uncultured Nonlabens sp.]|uniref:PQQ-dependent sugar dehydrogenase n=1 Tax=uncultured Nonlabens sp. TaxID=859306 RepID=UPI00260471D6|nr:PQQ-dependent sugar dehydrogenase [uncultured Nonlabens sp.]
MKNLLFTFALFMSLFMLGQNPETSGRNWTVTKLADVDQLVSFPNEITYGPDNWLWITERATHNNDIANNGERVVRVHPDTGVKTEMINLSAEVFSESGQDGLMGMAIHPDLYTDVTTTTNNYVYLALTYQDNTSSFGKNRRTRIVRFSYDNATNTLDAATRFVVIEGLDGSNDHNSGRMKIGPDLKIYYTSGDLGANQFQNVCQLVQSQALPTQTAIAAADYFTYKGKTLRMNLDGTIPADNPKFYPFAVPDGSASNPFTNSPVPDNADTMRPDSEKVQSHIFTYGHRNAQGIVFDSNGTLFQSEHGDRVDDEVHVLVAGKNYGWPLIVGERDDLGYEQCIKGSGACASNGNNCPPDAITHKETDFPLPIDFQGPIATYGSTVSSVPSGGFLSWPTVAPSSIDIYEGNGSLPFGKNIFVPTLKKGTIYRYGINTINEVTTDLIEFHSTIDRYRDMAISPDGSTIYAVTDSSGSTSGPSGSSSLGIANPGVVFKIEYTKFPEPSSQATNFVATENGRDIDLTWDNVTGTNMADGYALAISTTPGNFPTYADGTQPNQDFDLTDGAGLALVTDGSGSYTFTELDEFTTYYFQLTAYSNLAKDIDYVSSPVAPEATATTTETQLLPLTVMITEIIDRAPTRNAMFIELYNYGTMPVDLGAVNMHLALSFSGGSNGREVALTGTIAPGERYIVGRDRFMNEYGYSPDLVDNGVVNGNGDDVYLLVNNGTFLSGTYDILDSYGILGSGGLGPWNYQNSRAVRRTTAIERSSTWVADQWDVIPLTTPVSTMTTPNEQEDIDFIYNNSWSPYDPSGTRYQAEDVIVENGTATLTEMTFVNSIRIDAGATLNLDSNGGFNTLEDLEVNGNLNASDGTIVFSGLNPQFITGNDFELGVLEVENDLTTFVDISITELLKVTDNLTIDGSNKMIIKSNATRTAYVGPVNGSITGNFAVEHYVPAKRSFRFLSPSVTTANSIRDNWQNDAGLTSAAGTHITGSDTGANGFDITSSGAPSLFTYNNTGQQWEAIANTSTLGLVAGKAYRMLVRGDRTVDLTNNAATPSNTTLTAIGNLVTGNVTDASLSAVAGEFNFIGNPYQAPVDLSTVLSRSNNVSSSFVYLWDPAINVRGAYVTVDVSANSSNNVSSLFNKYLQPNTSFFISTAANGAASVSFTESDKDITAGFSNSARNSATTGSISVQLYEQTELQNGMAARDGVVVRFDPASSNAVDGNDAIKFSNLDETLSFINGTNKLSIENRFTPQDNETLFLDITNYRAVNYALSLDVTTVGLPVYLKDNFLGSYTLLNSGSNIYNYSIQSTDAASSAANRFEIKFSNTVLSLEELDVVEFTIYPNPTSSNRIIHISGTSVETITSVSLYNMLGQQIINWNEIDASNNEVQLDLGNNLKVGNYILQIKNGSGNTTSKQLIIN